MGGNKKTKETKESEDRGRSLVKRLPNSTKDRDSKTRQGSDGNSRSSSLSSSKEKTRDSHDTATVFERNIVYKDLNYYWFMTFVSIFVTFCIVYFAQREYGFITTKDSPSSFIFPSFFRENNATDLSSQLAILTKDKKDLTDELKKQTLKFDELYGNALIVKIVH